MLSWMKWTRSASLSSFSTTEACEIPIEASKESDFTISGKASFFGLRKSRPRGAMAKPATRMR